MQGTVQPGSSCTHLRPFYAGPMLLAVGAILGGAAPAPARVIGDIVGIGYRAGGEARAGAGPVVRAGAWVPIRVALSLENQATFDGKLRVNQPDLDGDFCYDEVPVHLRADSGPQKTYWLYAVAGASPTTSDYAVTLVDEEGEAVRLVSGGRIVRRLEPPAPPQVLPDERYLILSLTPEDRSIGQITRLTQPEQVDKLRRPVHVAHVTPSQMPAHWFGLEMVDCIVWDEADATALTHPQWVALIDWVKHGGKLLIASARRADTLAQSELLDPLLPVDIGPVVSTRRLPNLRRRLLGPFPEGDKGYRQPIPVAYCTLRKASGVYEVLTETKTKDGPDAAAATGSVLVARRRVDRGQVIFVGAALRDLLDSKGSPATFFTRVLGLRGSVAADIVSAHSLFPALQDTVGFFETGGAYMVLAFLFALVYLGVSTFGVWSFLKARGWARHSWPAFAATGIAASVLSVLGVQTIRGIGQELHQLTIVDVEAGRYDARATCYFGLRTGTHTELDVWMPSNYPQESEPGETHGFLRPMPELPLDVVTERRGYTDPSRYRLVPASAELTGVPIRATLKQFEGRWEGTLPGQVRASIRILRNVPLREETLIEEEADVYYEDVFSPDSTITNNLGADLTTCYILQATKNVMEGANFVCLSPRAGTADMGAYIYAHQIRGGIKDGETIRLAERIYSDKNGRPIPPKKWLERSSLWAAQSDWGRRFTVGIGFGGRKGGTEFEIEEGFQDALLLLTTLSEYHPLTLRGLYGEQGLRLLDERCRHLDFSDLLTKDVVILIGFTEDPGPVKLCTGKGGGRYRPVNPSKAWTIYRVLIPVTG